MGHFSVLVIFSWCEPDLVTDPVEGIFTLAQVLDQFLGLKKTHALLLGLLQEEVP